MENRDAEDRARLEALRQAIQVGIDDLNDGRCRRFDSFEELDRHVSKIADRAIARHRADQKRK